MEIFSNSFKENPFWWDSYLPISVKGEPPEDCDVAIVGSGFTGLNAAIELAKKGLKTVVFDAREIGYGASTRSGGLVSGGVTLGKHKNLLNYFPSKKIMNMKEESVASFHFLESLVSKEKLDCYFEKNGRFILAHSKKAYKELEEKYQEMKNFSSIRCEMIPEERQYEEVGSNYYYGGMLVHTAGAINPALYVSALINLAKSYKVNFLSNATVKEVKKFNNNFLVYYLNQKIVAKEVIIATNGYTQSFNFVKRRLVPVASYMIATEVLKENILRKISPNKRTLVDTKKNLFYIRFSHDHKRLLFGARPTFLVNSPRIAANQLHAFMVDVFPFLRHIKITHAWKGNVAMSFDGTPHIGSFKGMHYCVGCNGSGVAMMSYLGNQVAKRILGGRNNLSSFEDISFPKKFFYKGYPWFLPFVTIYFTLRDKIDRFIIFNKK